MIVNTSDLYIQIGSRRTPARIYRKDPENDLAVLKISGNFAFHFPLQKIDNIKECQKVYCFGFPFAGDSRMRNMNIVEGYISRLIEDEKGQLILVQINAPIIEGFSGGPVLEVTRGNVIGIITTRLKKHPKYDETFFIPINTLFSLISDFELDSDRISWIRYAKRLVNMYETSFKHYINLRCRNTEGETHDLMRYVLDVWLPDKKISLLSILGDFGSGKTLFCHRLAYEMAKKYLDDKENTYIPVPIILQLREYTDYGNMRDFLTDQVATVLGFLELSWQQMEVMLTSGKILLIYDGFDEMTIKASEFQIMENFKEIRNTIMPEAKVILTCRIHYFGTEHEEEKPEKFVIRARRPDFIESLIIDRGEPEQTSIIYLEDLTDNDVQRYLKNKIGNKWEDLYHKIKSPQFYDLNDLSKRPIFLDVIVETIPEFEFIEKKITGTGLYRKYTKLCFEREARTRGLSHEVGSQLVEEIAFESYARVHSYVTNSVVNMVSGRLKIKQKELQQFLRKCPFIKRSKDASGRFTFIHQSFLEYFIAKKIARDIQTRDHTSYVAEYLTSQIDKYLSEILETDNNMQIIAIWLERHPDVNVRMNCALTIGRSGLKKYILLLKKCMEKEKDIGVAGRISEALANLGVADAVENFLGNLERYSQLKQETGKSDSHRLLYDIVGPLKITNKDVINKLIRNLSSENARIRKYAAFILGRIGSPDSVPELIYLLDTFSEPIRTRRYVAAALGLIGDSCALPILEKVRQKCKNEYLRQDCLKAIERIKERNKQLS